MDAFTESIKRLEVIKAEGQAKLALLSMLMHYQAIGQNPAEMINQFTKDYDQELENIKQRMA